MDRLARLRLGVALCLLAWAGSAGAAPDWYKARGAQPPNGNRLFICHGYSCRVVTPVTLSAAELALIAAPLSPDVITPAAERQALSAAVQTFEMIVGARIGTGADLAGMQFGRGSPDQMDCIDEATNTTSLLRLLAEQGVLKHHRVLQPSARGFFLDGRYPHATAVLAETETRVKWAIDSWPRANGEPPVIQLLSEWRRSRSGVPLHKAAKRPAGDGAPGLCCVQRMPLTRGGRPHAPDG